MFLTLPGASPPPLGNPPIAMTTYYLQPDRLIAMRPGSKNSDEFFSCFGSEDP